MSAPPVDPGPLGAKLAAREAVVAVLGLGYVGLPLLRALAGAGFPVVGVEPDPGRLASLREGRSYISDLSDAQVAELVAREGVTLVGALAEAGPADVVILCVPTPLSKTKEPDLRQLRDAVTDVAGLLRPGQLVVVESTTFPGTTEELVVPLLGAGGLRVGEDLEVAYSPERVDPSNPRFGLRNTPKVVGGASPRATALATALYEAIVDEVVPVSSPTAAEMTKQLENVFRQVNIALVNEFALLCDQLGVDVWEVIAAASTKPFGFMPFYPGPGLGGHCIPVDPLYLSWKMRSLDQRARFIELADKVNSEMPEYVATRITRILNDRARAVRGSRILLLGVAYKPGVSDIRHTPALALLRRLRDMGAELAYHDPHVPEFPLDEATLRSVDLDAADLPGQDLVVLTTAHPELDLARVAAEARVVFDTRNAFAGVTGPARIVRL